MLGAGMSLLFISTGLIGGMSTVFTTVWSFFSQAPYFQQERFVLQPASILSVVVFLATAMAFPLDVVIAAGARLARRCPRMRFA